MIRYVDGLDGGGTKTAVIIADLSGKILHSFNSGAMNYNGESDINVNRNFADIFGEISSKLDGLDGCGAVCIGAAGVSNPAARAALEQAVRGVGYNGPLTITGDHQTALYGALGKPCGMILIAGTGSICYGKNSQGDEHRTGGFGYLIDDEGSGYAIGRDILSAVVRAYDGRMGKTVLSEMVLGALGLTSIQELIGFIYSKETNKRDIAALSSCLTLACERQDAVAAGIAEKCSTKLQQLVAPVAEKLGLLEGELAIAGSILLKDKYIRNGLVRKTREAYPEMKCVIPRNSAAYGAALMAIESLKKIF